MNVQLIVDLGSK